MQIWGDVGVMGLYEYIGTNHWLYSKMVMKALYCCLYKNLSSIKNQLQTLNMLRIKYNKTFVLTVNIFQEIFIFSY